MDASDPTGAAPRPTHLGALPGPRRLAVGLFLLSILGFYALAQVQLATAVGGGRPLPGPDRVLLKYHGDARSKLERVLDPSLPDTDPHAMSQYLPADDRAGARAKVLAWVAAGAPATGWPDVEPILAGEATCALCHSAKPFEDGSRRQRADLPLDTYEGAKAVARPGEGMSVAQLAETSHNHAFGFAVAALLVSLVFTHTRWRGPIVPLLIAGASAGAAVDVASWWLTRSYGSPWQWGVMLGGAAFGASISTMALLALDEAWAGGRLGALLARACAPLRLGRRETP
jgi:hypothetical protein